MIIEILDRNPKADHEAAKFIFTDLCEEQNALDVKVISQKDYLDTKELPVAIPMLNSNVTVHMLTGSALIAPSKKKY